MHRCLMNFSWLAENSSQNDSNECLSLEQIKRLLANMDGKQAFLTSNSFILTWFKMLLFLPG